MKNAMSNWHIVNHIHLCFHREKLLKVGTPFNFSYNYIIDSSWFILVMSQSVFNYSHVLETDYRYYFRKHAGISSISLFEKHNTMI